MLHDNKEVYFEIVSCREEGEILAENWQAIACLKHFLPEVAFAIFEHTNSVTTT